MTEQIKSTTEYEKFSFIDKNRKIDPSTLKSLIESMKSNPHLVSLNPILVNDEFKIFDGQHRFKACQALQIPVFYLQCPLLKESDIIHLNKDRKNWSIDSYIKYHVISGNENFIKLAAFSHDTGLTISMSCLFLGLNRRSLISEIKDGSLVFPLEQKENKAKIAISAYKNFIELFAKDKVILKKISSYSFGEAISSLPEEVNIKVFFERLINHISSLSEMRGMRDYHAAFKALRLI